MTSRRAGDRTLFESFVRSESFGGVLLVVAAIASFLWANSSGGHFFTELKEMPIGFHFGEWFVLEKHLIHWINDGLMVIFFLFVGLEIKRELITGELADRRAAMLPILAAVGGMVTPALVYAVVNWGGDGLHGWGVPTATDIAFALGILTLLGKRVPLSLKIFLTALAIVDDLGAVVLIAIFYTDDLSLPFLGLSLGCWGLALLYNRRGGRDLQVYAVIGVLTWYFMLQSGMHATVAGVLMALAIPMRRARTPWEVKSAIGALFKHETFELEQVELDLLEELVDEAQSPLHELEHSLEDLVAYGIMPVFALFNAGFVLSADASLGAAISLGAFLGLLAGKVVGVMGACWLAVRLGFATLPRGSSWMTMLGTSILAGIGFTMSLFIAGLAFSNPVRLDQAKLGVLSASIVAALAGLAVLAYSLPKKKAESD
jgi:Na+:H+ antiporter, NhaA family